MLALDVLSNSLAQRFTWTLIHFVWQGFLIALLLAVVVEFLRPRSTNLRYALSLAALITMLAAVPLTWLVIGPQFAEVSSGTFSSVLAPPIGAAEAAPVFPGSPSSISWWWTATQPLLFGCWLAGFLSLSARLFFGWLATQSLLRTRIMLPRQVAVQLTQLGWRLQTSIPRVVFASEQVAQAVAVGFLRPVVLLPAAWLLELPPNLLEAVVAHELAHLRRCDLWVNLLQRVAEALLFYHPAIWWLSARLRRERELCCDEMAVAATGQRLEYAEALELTARWATVDGRPALAAGFFGEGKMNLLHRVRCVLGISSERPASLWPASLLLGTLSLALLAAIYAASSSAVNADDERPAAKKEGEAKRDGDRPAASEADRFLNRAPREGEVRRDGDRPREGEVRRDGDRPREGEIRRDGDRPREGEVRRDGDRPREGEVRRDADGRRPPVGGENAELLNIIQKLRAEVTELRAEVARLRGGSAGVRRPGGEGDRPREGEVRRDGDRPREGEVRRDGDRPREGEIRRDGDRPRPEGAPRDGERPRTEGAPRDGERPKAAEGDRR